MAECVIDVSNLPSWISAIAAVTAVGISLVAKSKVEKVTPDYAVVSNDGVVLRHSGFGRYGLSVKLSEEEHPSYILSFSEVPQYFEVSTMEGATVKLEQVSPKEYKLLFVGAGFGSPLKASNFKVQAY